MTSEPAGPEADKRNEFLRFWPLLGASMAMLFFVHGAYLYALPFAYPEIIRDTGWSREQVTLIFSIGNFFGAVSAIIFGRLLDVIGDRRGILLAAVANSISVAALLLVSTLWQYYLVGALIGLTVPGVVAGIKIMLSRQFERNPGSAVGIGLSGSNLAGILIPTVTVMLLATVGWREALAATAIGTWVIALPIFFLVTRNMPDDRPAKVPGAKRAPTLPMLRDLAGGATFWKIGISLFLISAIHFGTIQHNVLFLEQDRGIDLALIGALSGIAATVTIFAKAGFGWLFDRLSVRGVMIAYALFIIDPLLSFVVSGPLTAALFVMVRALGHGALLIDAPVLAKQVYGNRNLGLPIGFLTAFVSMGGAVGPIVMGRIYSMTGSYDLAFILFSAFALVATLLIARVQPTALLAARNSQASKPN